MEDTRGIKTPFMPYKPKVRAKKWVRCGQCRGTGEADTICYVTGFFNPPRKCGFCRDGRIDITLGYLGETYQEVVNRIGLDNSLFDPHQTDENYEAFVDEMEMVRNAELACVDLLAACKAAVEDCENEIVAQQLIAAIAKAEGE